MATDLRNPDGPDAAADLRYGRDVFVGRANELRQLSDRADQVLAGHTQSVWIEGATGSGKTTLLNRFLSELNGFTVLAANGDPTESSTPYGLLDQLAAAGQPIEPGHQPPTSDTTPAAAGMWLLRLLHEHRAGEPVAVVVDDVQWADSSSAQAIGYALRRLAGSRVLTLMAVSDPGHDRHIGALTGHLTRNHIQTSTIILGGLSVKDIRSLSTALTGRRIPLLAARRLWSHMDGNPSYVTSLLTELDHGLLTDAGTRMPVPEWLVTTMRRTSERLPPDSRRLLEALAVLGDRCPLVRAAALARVTNPAWALGPLLDADLVTWCASDVTNRVTMTRPIYGDAVYQLLAPAWRAQLHATAATMVDRHSSWSHRVAAASVADGALATELEREAEMVADAARPDLAAQYLGWAAQLSAPREEHERRFLSACVYTGLMPESARAEARRAEIEACQPSALRDCALGICLLFEVGDLSTAETLLARVLRTPLADDQAWLRCIAAATTAALHLWRGDAAGVLTGSAIGLTSPEVPRLVRDVALALRATARSRLDGLRAGLSELTHVTAHPEAATIVDLRCLVCRGALRFILGEYTEAIDDLSAAIKLARAHDWVGHDASAYCYLAAARYRLGHWNDATTAAEQAIDAQEDTMPQHFALTRMVASLVPAARGESSTAAAYAAAARGRAEALGTPADLRHAAIAGAVVARARKDSAAMLAALRLVNDAGGPSSTADWWDTWWRPLRVEALLDVGELETAEQELRLFEQTAAELVGSDDDLSRLWAGLAARRGARSEALEIYAARVHDRDRWSAPLSRAILEHEYGRLLLEGGYRTDARVRLAQAYRRFAALGAWPYARRTEDDLRYCDHNGTQRAVAGMTGLTKREKQVANLVARDRTNREIANELYITTKTVEYHLSKIYAKLGVTSRHEFKRLLDHL